MDREEIKQAVNRFFEVRPHIYVDEDEKDTVCALIEQFVGKAQREGIQDTVAKVREWLVDHHVNIHYRVDAGKGPETLFTGFLDSLDGGEAPSDTPPPATDFQKELEGLINRYSKENESDTPDFILVKYLEGCLAVWSKCVNRRENWFGRKPFKNTFNKLIRYHKAREGR